MFLSISFANSSLVKIIPPRGPRKALCVVAVTTSAYFVGLSTTFPATNPIKCAASTIKWAPTSSAISLNF